MQLKGHVRWAERGRWGGRGGAAVVQILSAVERVDEVTGELFYDIDVNIKSFADNNQVRAVCMCE